MSEQISRYLDFSGMVQRSASPLLMKDNELVRAVNARANKLIGGISRRDGYELVGSTVQHGKSVKGGVSFFPKSGPDRLMVDINNSDDTYSTIKKLEYSSWNDVVSNLPQGLRGEHELLLDYVFNVGYSKDLDAFMDTSTIDSLGNYSTSTNVYGAPKAKFITKFKDSLYVANVEVNGKRYPNRVYKSSTPTDAITFVNGDQVSGSALQITLDSVRYLKAGMTLDIYGENSNTKKIDSLTIISVDKSNNTISFVGQAINISDRDEIYLEDKKGTPVILWNTDFPNPDTADFIEIPPVKNEIQEIKGTFFYNNRYFIFTEHSIWKWDGANLVCVSNNIGTTSHSSIKEVGGFMVFLHTTGVWAYNDSNGQLQNISRGIKDHTDAISQFNLYSAVAIAYGDIYKLVIGELGEIGEQTTSTSTSSTSTSSTSSSTSSTSTSSTSTSTTVTPTTSTSSTSRSTSSTSVSTSSTSVSTSSTSSSTSSTSTSTVMPTTQCTVLVYDFSMNAWSTDQVDRNITTYLIHRMNGLEKIYFGDDTGRLFRDETGYSDNGKSIPFLIETKPFDQGVPEETKPYRRAYIYTKNGQMATAQYSVDGKEWKTFGQLSRNVTPIELGDIQGRNIAFRILQNDKGVGVVLLGISLVWLRGTLTNVAS